MKFLDLELSKQFYCLQKARSENLMLLLITQNYHIRQKSIIKSCRFSARKFHLWFFRFGSRFDAYSQKETTQKGRRINCFKFSEIIEWKNFWFIGVAWSDVSKIRPSAYRCVLLSLALFAGSGSFLHDCQLCVYRTSKTLIYKRRHACATVVF